RRGVAQSELRRGDQHLHPVAGRLERGAPPFLAVHHGEHAQHAPPFALDRPDRLQRGLASGDHVFHDHRRGAGGEASLDALSRAVRLGLLADREGVECSPSCRAGRSDGAGDGVSAEREPAHQLGPPPGGREPLEGDGPDHRNAFCRNGLTGSVAVEDRTAAGCNGTGAAVSSGCNSPRGVRPVYGWTPVRSQYAIVARLKMSARPPTSSPDRTSGATYWSVPTKNPVRVSRSSAGSSASRAIPKSSSLTRSVAVS